MITLRSSKMYLFQKFYQYHIHPLKKRKRLIYFFLCCTSITLFILACNLQLLSFRHIQYLYNKHIGVKIYVLYWDSFHGEKDFSFGYGNSIFKDCPYSNCYATDDREFLKVEDFDAIIFHGARFNSFKDGLPKVRKVNQRYIFFGIESAFNTYFDDYLYENFYNWTFTYRRDSDIPFPYGIFTKKKKELSIDQNALRNKFKPVAWFVSNCGTEGAVARMQYVKELSNYIPVDIYGSCGNLTCNDKLQCYEMLENDYFFYLSFENSFCEDYITEKLFNVLNYNVIPVVRGAADYRTLSPPNSVININDFSSVQNLTNHLRYLSKNLAEYSKYFRWKKEYVVNTDLKKDVMCKLCEKLNTETTRKSYKSIKYWFYRGCWK